MPPFYKQKKENNIDFSSSGIIWSAGAATLLNSGRQQCKRSPENSREMENGAAIDDRENCKLLFETTVAHFAPTASFPSRAFKIISEVARERLGQTKTSREQPRGGNGKGKGGGEGRDEGRGVRRNRSRRRKGRKRGEENEKQNYFLWNACSVLEPYLWKVGQQSEAQTNASKTSIGLEPSDTNG